MSVPNWLKIPSSSSIQSVLLVTVFILISKKRTEPNFRLVSSWPGTYRAVQRTDSLLFIFIYFNCGFLVWLWQTAQQDAGLFKLWRWKSCRKKSANKKILNHLFLQINLPTLPAITWTQRQIKCDAAARLIAETSWESKLLHLNSDDLKTQHGAGIRKWDFHTQPEEIWQERFSHCSYRTLTGVCLKWKTLICWQVNVWHPSWQLLRSVEVTSHAEWFCSYGSVLLPPLSLISTVDVGQ